MDGSPKSTHVLFFCQMQFYLIFSSCTLCCVKIYSVWGKKMTCISPVQLLSSGRHSLSFFCSHIHWASNIAAHKNDCTNSATVRRMVLAKSCVWSVDCAAVFILNMIEAKISFPQRNTGTKDLKVCWWRRSCSRLVRSSQVWVTKERSSGIWTKDDCVRLSRDWQVVHSEFPTMHSDGH